MKVLRHHHPGLNTPNLDQTCRFYVSILGLSIAHEFRNDAGERYAVFLDSGNGTFLEFFQVPFSDYIAHLGPLRHICFEVADIEVQMWDLRGHGYKIEGVRRGRTDKVLQFFIEDPHGLKIEFQQHDEHSALRKYLEAGKNG